MDKEHFKKLAKENEDTCAFVSKELGFLSRRLKKTDFDKNNDMYLANIVESQFLLSGVAVAQKAFSQMIADKQEDPESNKSLKDYFTDKLEAMYVTKEEEKTGGVEDVGNN